MTFALKPYAAYRDPGLPWLGRVPEHWEVRKLRHLLRRVSERNRPDLPLLSVVREKGVILRNTVSKDENSNYIPDDLSNYKVVRAGQFAVNKMKAWQGSYGVSGYDGIVSPAYFVFEVGGLDGRFFHAAIRSRTYVPFFAQASDGVRIGQWDLAEARMKEIPFAVAPDDEQAAIVRFLDHADRHIRRYIRAKQKLIKLLEEQKLAIVHQAVTKGLEPDVRMRDPGVEWLGEVPAHWDVRRTKSAAKLRSGHTPSRQHPEYWQDCTIPWFGLVDVWQIRDGQIEYVTDTNEKISELGLANSAARLLPAGTVMLSRTASVGFSAIMGIDMATTQDFVNWVCGPSLLPEYLLCVFRAMQPEFRRLAMGSTHQTIYMPDVGKFLTPIPTIQEQSRIVASIRDRTGEIGALVALVHKEIERAQEYRTVLISAVVTGKFDVREAAADPPAEPEEPELLDEAEVLDESDKEGGDAGSDDGSEEAEE